MKTKTLKEVTLEEMLEVAKFLVTEEAKQMGKFVYNLKMEEIDGERVKKDKYWIKVENGEVSWGEGHLDDPEATLFTVNRGGVDTLLAMQIYGLKAATNAMLLGYISASDLKKAQKWFKLLKWGEDEVIEGFKKLGIEIKDLSLDIYEELQLE